MIVVACAVAAELPHFPGSSNALELLVTGVGPVEAAAATALRLARGDVDLVVNAGIAGAFAGTAAVGDAAIVYEEFMEVGLETGESIALPNGQRVTERAHASQRFFESLIALGYQPLRGVTVSRVTATDATAARLAALGAQVETMEGYAVLRAAQLAGVPAVEVRGISNIVGDRASSGWNFAAGVAAAERVLTDFIRVIKP